MAAIVADYAGELDWSHTSIAYHMYTGTGGEITSTKLPELSREYRLICTEWDYPGRWNYVPTVDGDSINSQTLERLGHSWIDWRDWGDTDHARLFGIAVPDAQSRLYWWGEYLTQPNPGHLSNLSARGWAGTRDATLIVGYVTRGEASATMPVLVRGVGPTLQEAPYGLSTAIDDPQLTVYRGIDIIDANDNWGGGNELADTFSRLGAFALIPTAADPATLGEVSPSQPTTVHVTPANGDPGTSLAELYDAITRKSCQSRETFQPVRARSRYG